MISLLQKTKSLLIAAAVLALSSLEAQGPSVNAVVVQQPCNNDGKIASTVTGMTPPLSFTYTNWMSGQVFTFAGVNSLSHTITGLPAYHTDAWSNPNYWSVMVSDGINSANATTLITPPFIDSVKVTPGICPSPNTVAAIGFAGGTAPFTCVWQNKNTSVIYNGNPVQVPDGDYRITITDAAGCVVTSASGPSLNISVYGQSSIILNLGGTSANCTNGTATVTATGGQSPYSYSWSNGSTSPTLTGLTSNSYGITVTDAQGCSAKGAYWVSQAVTLNFNTTITNATCVQNNGSVMSFVSGGTAPYSFLWSNGSTTQNLTNIPGGNYYNVKIIDANGCSLMSGAYVGVSTPVNVTYVTAPSSCTAATGAATLNISGGQTPYNTTWYLFPNNLTGNSVSNLAPGTYAFSVTDANGCKRSGSVIIPPVSNIIASTSATSPVCPATTGNIGTSVSGSNPPFTYLWSNNATTSALTGVATGYYSVKITDAVGCSVTKGESLYANSPVTIGLNTSPATCKFSNDGTITAVAAGGQTPYTYSWSNNQNGSTISGLAPGNYYVTATDANGCKNTSKAVMSFNQNNNSCYCTLTGTVYNDANANCTQDAGEIGIPGIPVHVSGHGYTFTNPNGVYSMHVPTGNYTVTQTTPTNYSLSTCETNNKTTTATAAANCVITINFANKVNPVHDLQIITSNFFAPPIPGNQYAQKVVVTNYGTVQESNIKLGYQHDGQLSFVSCTPWTLTQQNAISYPDWYSISAGFATLNPQGASSSIINYNVPTNIPVNTLVEFKDSVAHAAPISTVWLTDQSPWNNVNTYQTQVVASYDPNYKEVMPKGLTANGNITKKDSMLTYVIHFQNTGSYFAQNIVLVDSLDANLNMVTLRPGYSDYSYRTTMTDNGVVKFHFNNINLPWQSAYGDVMSSGMVTYTIKMKKNLAIGSQIRNKAAIYFDYNEPVITNTTLNTLVAASTTGLAELKVISGDDILLFPNPSSGDVTMVFNGKEAAQGQISITDISGRQVSSNSISIEPGTNTVVNRTTELQNGIYLVTLRSGTESITKKLVIAK
jgi:uncharacterized repeat protein (TIGR01451 family)